MHLHTDSTADARGPGRRSPSDSIERALCQIDRSFNHFRDSAEHMVRFGKALRVIRARMFRRQPAAFDGWCQTKLKLSGKTVRSSYFRIGKGFSIAEVKGKALTAEALRAILPVTQSRYRTALLEQGQHQKASTIRMARALALTCESEEQGLAAIRAVLQRGELPAGLGTPGPKAGPKPRPSLLTKLETSDRGVGEEDRHRAARTCANCWTGACP